ncbi:hypothetical protein SERLADRAFT_358714 [Serpula lacrymans var. lacrymans S7.9]|uniref:Major facilitator superfamily (MFS) profile domain-containing protein n=1 Tax=Serpula lacrymans var. lacrymans (strain S7.9) TaxID=578457 RepID=F8PCM6_SERL9|nr:uncharacterized protein SERLADRAFT_358714 [Serpula lacrymans var. lacrymans S7.9]EGO18976.1 hypothetical protein SERLADRAFT_358714 [Serpula lacrymans var. lacrymans S7.9]
MMGIFALIAGFMRSKILLILFRAFMGAGGALTMPSALHLIVHMYPNPAEQAKAVAAFGGMVSLVPNISHSGPSESRSARLLRFRRLDLVGVSAFTVALILFIFAVTSGSIDGWGSAAVIAPLVISAFLLLAFFLWEARLPESHAALPPKMWRYENFTILVAISLVPFMWWGSVFLLFSWLWEPVYGWSAIDTAVHFLPIGLGIFPVLPLSAGLQSKLPLKWVILLGHLLLLAGTLLLPFANSKERYWPFVLPGFLLGTAGAALIYTTTNIALLAITPPEVSGIVSAVFTCVLQTGAALGVAIVTSIQTSVQISHGGPDGFQGRAAGLWFLVAFIATMTILFTVFMKNTVGPVDPNAPQNPKETPEKES